MDWITKFAPVYARARYGSTRAYGDKRARGGRGGGKQTARESNSRRGKLLPPGEGGGQAIRAIGGSTVKAPRFDNKDLLLPPRNLAPEMQRARYCKGNAFIARSFARTREDTGTGKEETFADIKAQVVESRRLIGGNAEETRSALHAVRGAI